MRLRPDGVEQMPMQCTANSSGLPDHLQPDNRAHPRRFESLARTVRLPRFPYGCMPCMYACVCAAPRGKREREREGSVWWPSPTPRASQSCLAVCAWMHCIAFNSFIHSFPLVETHRIEPVPYGKVAMAAVPVASIASINAKVGRHMYLLRQSPYAMCHGTCKPAA